MKVGNNSSHINQDQYSNYFTSSVTSRATNRYEMQKETKHKREKEAAEICGTHTQVIAGVCIIALLNIESQICSGWERPQQLM